jgi:hypothetical protein
MNLNYYLDIKLTDLSQFTAMDIKKIYQNKYYDVLVFLLEKLIRVISQLSSLLQLKYYSGHS